MIEKEEMPRGGVPLGHRTADYWFDLPQELIAQDPLEDRSSSRLLVLDKKTGVRKHGTFRDILQYLEPGDAMILNDTKVIPARLLGQREGTGAAVEILLLKRLEADVWECLVRPGKKLRPGARAVFGDGTLKAEILEVAEGGNRLVRFEFEGIFEEVLDRLGEMPLPPYITHKLKDRDRYQTVYAKYEGSAAAPTAGLHFTERVLDDIRAKGIETATVCLHVGAGTFLPVKSSLVSEHSMHRETFVVTSEFLHKLLAGKGKLIAVGTTSVRTLESLYYAGVKCIETGEPGDVAQWEPYEREYVYSVNDALEALVTYMEDNSMQEIQLGTSIIIVPGYEFKVVDILVTNFHQPQSTLLLLISAFVKGDWRNIYDFALKNDFRFLSYGDSSVLFKA